MNKNNLAVFEVLSQTLYAGTSSIQQRAEAHQQLLTFQSTSDIFSQCQFILNNSTLPYAQLAASSTLEKNIIRFWYSFTDEKKIDIRNYVLNYLAKNAHILHEFVVGNLTKVCCIIIKLGWFDSPEFRAVVDEISIFLEETVDHKMIGLKLLTTLVGEMNLSDRKIAVSFRDQILLQIFLIAVQILRNLQQRTEGSILSEKETTVVSLSLTLATECLSFNFVDTNPDSNDVGTVSLPSSWRTVVQDTTTMQLFFDFYELSEPPRSNSALNALVQLSLVCRSLFASEKDRFAVMDTLIAGIQSIMQSKKGLEHIENHHEFCRLLSTLKAGYQLVDLIVSGGFMTWLELVKDFTTKALLLYRVTSINSNHYLLSLWANLATAMSFIRRKITPPQQFETLQTCLLQVVESFVKTMLDSVDVVVASNGVIDDPLEEEWSLREQMGRIAVIARFQYDTVAQYLQSMFEQALLMYEQQAISMPANTQIPHQLRVLEGRLTWLTYIVTSLINLNAPRKNQGELIWDGRLSRCVFLLIHVVEFRLNCTVGQCKCDWKLEMATLNYLKSFKDVYICSTDSATVVTGAVKDLSGGFSTHPLLFLARSNLDKATDEKKLGSAEILLVYDAMGIGDIMQVMNIVVNKLCNNFKFWHRCDKILVETLEVFVELVSTCSLKETLLHLETVNFLVLNHSGAHFAFLGFDSDNKHRTVFYSALSHLVFSSSEDPSNSFAAFVTPHVAILSQLAQAPDLRLPVVKVAIIAALRDLRGIYMSAYNKRIYTLLFDALFSAYQTLFLRVAETLYDDSASMTALLKLMKEIVWNKGQRLCFDNSSANGILLFRGTSDIMCAYGSRILQMSVQQNIYQEKYKGIRLMLNTVTNALSGNYVNFGIFSLYNDKALQNVLDVSLLICLQIPLSDVMAYVKLSRAYFGFIEILLRNHLDVMADLAPAVFIQFVKNIQDGLEASDLTVSAQCASCLDHIAAYTFLDQNQDEPIVQLIRAYIQFESDVLHRLMVVLFSSLLLTRHDNHWTVAKPILYLLLASDASFTDSQNQFMSTQAPENQKLMIEEFDKLTADLQRSVQTVLRDRFTQKLVKLRVNMRQF